MKKIILEWMILYLHWLKKNNVNVLDYRHYFESNESYFENQDHINNRGAEVLTQEVIRVIKNDL